jgi:hypothetical protein
MTARSFFGTSGLIYEMKLHEAISVGLAPSFYPKMLEYREDLNMFQLSNCCSSKISLYFTHQYFFLTLSHIHAKLMA